MNFAPFQSLERLFHEGSFTPNMMTEKFIQIIQDHAPEGHGYSLETISKYGERFLKNICSVRTEGFNTWEIHRRDISKNSELLSFFGWGIFGELYADKLLQKYNSGENTIQSDNPQLGIELIDGLVDINYDFINLHYYGNNPEEENDVDDE